jgi:aminopeptidase N
MGAMENWGLVTYREVDLLIDPVKASSQQKQRVCQVVTHELSHQWYDWNSLSLFAVDVRF